MTTQLGKSERMWLVGVMSYIVTLMLAEIHILEASGCSSEQISSCQTAAASDNTSESPGGGVCQPKRYVHFTHLCTVTNYVPSISHCCCAQAEQVLCCRYHYDWNYFRCVEADDTIYTIGDKAWSQELLLTVILIPTISGLCCLIWCIRCLLYHPDDDYTSHQCSKCACKDRDLQDEEVEAPLKVNQIQTEKQWPPDNSQPSHLYCSVPSAPPLDHNTENNCITSGCQSGTPQSRILLQYVVIEPDPGGNLDTTQHKSNCGSRSNVSQAIVYPNYNLKQYGLGHSKYTNGTTGGTETIQNLTLDLPTDPPPAYEGFQTNSGGVLTTKCDANITFCDILENQS